jgi:hypothetical protein
MSPLKEIPYNKTSLAKYCKCTILNNRNILDSSKEFNSSEII